MLDIKFIRENKGLIKDLIKDKNIDLDLNELLRIDEEKLELKQKTESLREERNKNADQLKQGLDNKSQLIEKGKFLKSEIAELEQNLDKLTEKYNELMLLVPNIIEKNVPVGKDEDDNVEVKKWGEPTKFNFEFKDHLQLGKDLDIIDTERGVKVSGFRGYFLKNQGTMLHLAVLMFALNKLIEKGFTPLITPNLVRKFALTGSGHFPFGKDEIYQVANPGRLEDGSEKEDTFLVGTSEPALLAYKANEIIDEKELPLKLCGYSQCYRSEIGSYGKDTKGVYRVHEFTKVEQVIICKNDFEESMKLFKLLGEVSEEILQELKLPYRVIEVCTGDMGAGKYKMYDIETWMPSKDKYGETHSNSHLAEWQARRLGIKFKDKDGKKQFCHTLNNTAIASPRILIAILENFQNKDGSVDIPEVLQKYMNGQNKIEKK